MSYVNSKKAAEYYQVTYQTLRRWCQNDKIKYKKTKGGHRRYYISLQNDFAKGKYIYARVSSNKQKASLNQQIKYLRNLYPKHIVIKDIGSGLNFKRPGLQQLLRQCFKGYVSEVVVASSDRLSRIGTDLFEWIFSEFQSNLIILNRKPFMSREKELSQDLLSILSHFSARYHGQRRYRSS